MDRSSPGYPCPCCGRVTFGGPPGSYEICAVCFWEDDTIQLRWPDYGGGANTPSLIEAQRTCAEVGAMESRFVGNVRAADESEPLDEGWRRIDLAVDRFEARGVQKAPWPADLTALYWRRSTFWRHG